MPSHRAGGTTVSAPGSHARAELAGTQGELSLAVGKALRREGAEWKASPKRSYTLEVGGE